MKIAEKGDLKYISFENIENTGLVNHCFSTRLGGVSKGHLESLNLAFNKGDDLENVIKNYEILGDAVGFDYRDCVAMEQTHDTRIHVASSADKGKGILKPTDIIGFDGLVTNQKGITLVTYHADCVPLYFVDTVNKAIGLSHAGWRGTVNNMARLTVEKMTELYGTNPRDIQAAIGPSIGVCCFEVDLPVVEEFREKLSFSDKYIKKCDYGTDKYKIDLWSINKEIMIKSGIKEENIDITTLCTKCNPNLFYSHRELGLERGSMAAFLQLK